MEQPKVHNKKKKTKVRSSDNNNEDEDNKVLENVEKINNKNGDAIEATTNVAMDEVKEVEEEKEVESLRQQESISVCVVDENLDVDGDVVGEEATGSDDKIKKGILGYMDRQMKPHMKTQSLSDPQVSPGQQRNSRSRNSNEKSPRRKRSKSESRRRRERKLIAAGEMEVRQANENLMKYLKQCTNGNDISLSGELEIDKSLEDRKVYRKTKAQRDRKSNFMKSTGRPPSDLTNVLNELNDDIVQHSGDIYNPFTPVVSPCDAPTRIDKMYIQTQRGYRSVDNTLFNNRLSQDSENQRNFNPKIEVACSFQRTWNHISTICHGLLGGLALAHLLFILTTKPYDWEKGTAQHYLAFSEVYANSFYCLVAVCMVSVLDRMDVCRVDLLSNASETISFRWIIILMIYVSTLILTLCAGTQDIRLYTSEFNVTVWKDEMESNKVLSNWNILSVARSVGAIMGWIMIGFNPNYDLLYEHLLEMNKYQLNNN